MELHQLKYFVKVAETLNFSEAARALCITQSTLSQQIRQLEGELDTPLFIRNSHSVALTEAGTELLPFARDTLNAADRCRTRIADLNKLAVGELNIGVTYSFSPMLTETILTFIKQYPKVKLNICYKPMAELMQKLVRREVDFVLAFRPIQPSRAVDSHILFQNTLSAVVADSHPLAALDKVTPAELEQYDLALPSPGLQARNAFEQLAEPYMSRMRIHIELNEVNILLRLVRHSRLVTILAQDTVYNESGLKAIPIDVPGNEMNGCVHTLRDSYYKQSMREFIRLLGESLSVRQRREGWL
ncbi:MAG: LysR family transcriptional regulator [Muribaculaceae bacterium]|nr:LysR family transcriptional regulator [Muribaculaceae bacterium]